MCLPHSTGPLLPYASSADASMAGSPAAGKAVASIVRLARARACTLHSPRVEADWG